MTSAEALSLAEKIVRLSGCDPDKLPKENFVEYSDQVIYAAKGLTREQRDNLPWFKDWLLAWRKLYDDFDKKLAADPMMLYRPANSVSLAFHKSDAFIRYFRAGNRTSKTQSGYAEHYFLATGQHKWRTFPNPRKQKLASFIIGLAYSKYAPSVFEAKLLRGEPDNMLSPMFPIGGKWFNHYNEKSKVLRIACPDCAEAGRAQKCTHNKAEIRLFSDEGGWEVLQGAQYNLGHFDEHIPEEFYNEAKQRLAAVENSALIVTGTPLHGPEAWEQRRLVRLAMDGPPSNVDERGRQIVSLHQINQFDAGLVSHDTIRRNMKDMDEFEIRARIYGEPAALAKNPVFNRKALQEQVIREPNRAGLVVPSDIDMVEQLEPDVIEVKYDKEGPLRIWDLPAPGENYIIGVDTAKGLTTGDASAASVLRFSSHGTGSYLDMVAQYHGWINPLDYADEIFKLAVFYNSALVAIELTGGYGEAVMLKLRQEHCYWNIFRDERNHAQAKHRMASKFGLETNVRTKPFMVAALQQFVRDSAISIPCAATISEMVAFEQERGQVTTQYRGASGSHDDRVMSLVIGASVAVSNPQEFILPSHKKPLSDTYSGEWLDVHRELVVTPGDIYDA